MDNLIFSLEATMPVFLLIVLGYFFEKVHILDKALANQMNRFAFQIALPVLVFQDLAQQDFAKAWNGKYVLFCFVITLASIGIAFLLSLPMHDKAERGEFIQATYRSSAAILGLAFIINIYGSSGMAPLMIIGTVPLYNVAAVIILTLTSSEKKAGAIKQSLIGILTNPILIGIVVGLFWSVCHLPYPVIFGKVVQSVANLATPLSLIAMGAAFEFHSMRRVWKQTLVATFMKLVGFVALFMPLAIRMGFRNSYIVALLVMMGSATTVSSYVMAINMHHKGELSAAVVSLTTLVSAFTLTMWLFIMKSHGWI
ncbi:MAG: AEC family transporter [Absicoccus sp.]|uniref:AEC family transporter n=1 Tax=Absicoccus intestinalis TaxID=2926319 RepID=A0ABU4WN12_9FIRM|nr:MULTISPECIES: AEC family transporter [unclassified Absicoccus]MDX8416920.1 AEC family transporter [Absicoccus sp. CLA-KB-P134]MDY3036136.1 AEC family transporter [Absicoccus sp.]